MNVKKYIPRAMLFAAALIWGSSFFIVKDTTDVLAPNLLLAIRFTTGAILLGAVFYKRLALIDKSYIKGGAVTGFFLFCAYCSQTIGITGTTPGKNAFLTAVYCVLVPFLFWIFGSTRPDRYDVAAAFVCFAGIGLVSLTDDFTIVTGDLLTLLGGFFYAAHIVAFAKMARKKDAILLTVLQFAFAAVFSWAVTLIFEDFPTEVPLPALLGTAYLAVFCTTIALFFQSMGQKMTPPAQASVILSLESVFGVAFSVAFGREEPTPRMFIGFAVIFVAVLISTLKPGKKRFGTRKRN